MSLENDLNSFIKLTNGQEIDNRRDVFNRLKEHVYLYPDDNISKYIKNWLLYNIQDEFLKPSLKEAFNMSDNLKYSKIVNIYQNLPCLTNNSEYQDYFYYILTNPSEYFGTYKNFINGCKNFFDSMGNNIVNDEIFTNIRRFILDNNMIFKAGWDTYGTLTEEYNNLEMINNNIETKEFIGLKPYIESKLRLEQKNYSYEDMIWFYKNEKIGKIGELYSYEELKKINPNTIFVSKECGNGFGYDLLFKTESIEYLIEVKACLTTSKDSFELTSNENDTLLDSLNRDRTIYVVDRVYIDLENNKISRNSLNYNKDTNSFYSYDDKGNIIEYTRNDKNPLRYDRKVNILTLKKED